MLIARYFLYVGGALLATLFAIDTLVPQDAVTTGHSAGGVDKSTVRIRSLEKLPERVVFDTSLPTIVPPASAVQVAAAPPPPAAGSEVRDTFAQFVPTDSKKPDSRARQAKAEQAEAPAPRRHKVARAHSQSVPQRPMYAQQPMYGQQQMMFGQRPVRLAQQQPRYGFFGGGPMWGTW